MVCVPAVWEIEKVNSGNPIFYLFSGITQEFLTLVLRWFLAGWDTNPSVFLSPPAKSNYSTQWTLVVPHEQNTDPKKKVFAPEDFPSQFSVAYYWKFTNLLTVLGVPSRCLLSPLNCGPCQQTVTHIPLCPHPQQLTNSSMMRPSGMTFHSTKKNLFVSTRSGSKCFPPPKPRTFSADRARIRESVTKPSTPIPSFSICVGKYHGSNASQGERLSWYLIAGWVFFLKPNLYSFIFPFLSFIRTERWLLCNFWWFDVRRHFYQDNQVKRTVR